jgi:hypothetical protein
MVRADRSYLLLTFTHFPFPFLMCKLRVLWKA